MSLFASPLSAHSVNLSIRVCEAPKTKPLFLQLWVFWSGDHVGACQNAVRGCPEFVE